MAPRARRTPRAVPGTSEGAEAQVPEPAAGSEQPAAGMDQQAEADMEEAEAEAEAEGEDADEEEAEAEEMAGVEDVGEEEHGLSLEDAVEKMLDEELPDAQPAEQPAPATQPDQLSLDSLTQLPEVKLFLQQLTAQCLHPATKRLTHNVLCCSLSRALSTVILQAAAGTGRSAWTSSTCHSTQRLQQGEGRTANPHCASAASGLPQYPANG